MENKETKDLNNELDSFLDQEKKEETKSEITNEEVVITPNTGLVEHIEKKLKLADGRELLKEETAGGNCNL